MGDEHQHPRAHAREEDNDDLIPPLRYPRNNSVPMHSPKVPPFGGDLRDLARFRHACHVVFRVNPYYTEVQKISLVAGWLCNDAAAWFRSQGEEYFPDSWTELLTNVVEGLDGGAHLELQEELDRRVLGPKENLITYRLDLHDMFNALDTPQAERTKRFIRGLPDGMATAVAAQQPRDWEEAFNIANSIRNLVKKGTRIETSSKMEDEPKPLPALLQPNHTAPTNSSAGTMEVDGLIKQMEKLTLALQPPRNNASMDNLVEKLTQVLSTRASGQGSGQTSFNTSRPSGRTQQSRCGKCHQEGHYQKECPNPPVPNAVQCTFCNMYGHTEDRCRAKQRRTLQQSQFMSLFNQLSPDQLESIIQLNQDHGPIDDGQLDYEDEEIVPRCLMFGLSLANKQVTTPFCEFLPPDKVVDTDYDSPSESSFVLSSDSEPDSDDEDHHDLPQILTADNVIRKRGTTRDRPPSLREAVVVDRPARKARKEKPPQPPAPPPAEPMNTEENDQAKISREEKKARRRQQSYRLFNSIMDKKQVSLLAQTSTLLPYGRKQLHTYVDDEILRYQSKSRKPAGNLTTTPMEPEEPTTTILPASQKLEFLPHSTDEPRVGKLCRIYVNITGMQVPAIVDSGSEFSVVSYDLIQAMGLADYVNTHDPPKFSASDHGTHMAKGRITLIVQIGKLRCKLPLVVTGGRAPSTYYMLLGQDFMIPAAGIINQEDGHVRFRLHDRTGYVYAPILLEENPKPVRLSSKN
jgi:hypothetical protein